MADSVSFGEALAMARRPLDNLGELQLAVMTAVWDLGEATVTRVRDQLAGERELAYTTVLSVMQKLEKAGWLKHRTDGRTYVYLPRRSRDAAERTALREFTERAFGGDPLVLFQHLLADERMTEAELAELRKMLERRRKELRDG